MSVVSKLFETEVETPEMKVSALSPWFGSKRTLAPEIVRELGKHVKYDEPFCGSCAVLLAKPVATCETVNDLHGDLVNLARVIAVESSAVQLYAGLARMLMCEGLFREAAKRFRANGNRPAEGSLSRLDSSPAEGD